MKIFCDIATTFFKDAPVVSKVPVNEHGFRPASASVQAVLAPKATATLWKRMYSMRMKIGWYNLSRGGALGVCVDAVRKSGRVSARKRLPDRGEAVMVMELERAVAEDEGRGEPDAIVAGAAILPFTGGSGWATFGVASRNLFSI